MKTPTSLKSVPVLPYYYAHGWRMIVLALALGMTGYYLVRPAFRWVDAHPGGLISGILAYLMIVVVLPPMAFLVAWVCGVRPELEEEEVAPPST